MLGIKRIVAGLLVGGGTVYFADHYHLVHTTEGLVVVPRAQQALLRSAYADVRGWDQTKWDQYPELTESLAKDGRGGFLLEGTMSGLLQQAGSSLGVIPSATPTGVSLPDRPPIVFESPAGPALPGSAAYPAASMQSAADDSLLGRLSRQLQSSPPAAAPVPARVEQPASIPRAPATTPPRTTGSPPNAAHGQAGLSEQQILEELYPSIHSAAMQRISPEVSRPAQAALQPLQDLRQRAGSQPAAAPQPAADFQPGGPVQQVVAPLFDAAGHPDRVLDVEGERLRERLPTTVQDTLRLFAPADGPSAQRPTLDSF